MHDDIKTQTEMMTAFGAEKLPGLVGIQIDDLGDGWIAGSLPVRPEVMAPNGFLHAGTVITLADTLCGYGCARALPEGASGFTTIETKSNHLSTAREGRIIGRAEVFHRGRTTQVWDAVIKRAEDDKTIALFRCTQMILWPKT